MWHNEPNFRLQLDPAEDLTADGFVSLLVIKPNHDLWNAEKSVEVGLVEAGSGRRLLTRPASATAGVVARNARNLYYSLPDVRSVPVKAGLVQAVSGHGLLTRPAATTAGVLARKSAKTSTNLYQTPVQYQ